MPLPSNLKRQQVEQALWKAVFARTFRSAPSVIPKVFQTRIKRLLEIDSTLFSGQMNKIHAFTTNSVSGQGYERRFSLFDSFMIGFALELLNAGFPQQDTVFLLQHIRPLLEAPFNQAMTYPVWDRNIRLAEDVLTAPQDSENPNAADVRVFVTLSKLDLKELYSNGSTVQPIISAPHIFYGYRSLSAFLNQETFYEPHLLILEIGAMATCIREAINGTMPITRGRKSNDGS